MSFIRKTVRELTPAVIAYEEEMPSGEYEAFLDSVITYINISKLFRVIYTVVSFITVFLPLFTRGRIFFWLGRPAQEDFLNKLLNSRFKLLRGVGTLITLPVKMVYYNGEEEMKRLGYDIQALKQDARLRTVNRTRDAGKGCMIK